MKISVEVSDADLESMSCDSLNEFAEQLRNQLDNAVVTDDGGVGADWMTEYQLEVVIAKADDIPLAAPIPERDSLYGFLRDASQWKLNALAELALWMEKHHELLLSGRSDGIRLGATQEVIQFMLESVNPEQAGMVAGNLVQIEN